MVDRPIVALADFDSRAGNLDRVAAQFEPARALQRNTGAGQRAVDDKLTRAAQCHRARCLRASPQRETCAAGVDGSVDRDILQGDVGARHGDRAVQDGAQARFADNGQARVGGAKSDGAGICAGGQPEHIAVSRIGAAQQCLQSRRRGQGDISLSRRCADHLDCRIAIAGVSPGGEGIAGWVEYRTRYCPARSCFAPHPRHWPDPAAIARNACHSTTARKDACRRRWS